jgi:hypothetical protein
LRHHSAATNLVRSLGNSGARGSHFGEFRPYVGDAPEGNGRRHGLRATARYQTDLLARGLKAHVIRGVGLWRYAEQGGIHGFG